MKKKLYLIFMMGMVLAMTSCGKKENENEQNVSNIEQSNGDDREMVIDSIPVDENRVVDALDIFSTGLFMDGSHKHDDGTRCRIWFRYEPNYASVEFQYYDYSMDADTQEPFLRLEMQKERIRVLLYDYSEKQNVLLEAEGMIDNVNPDNLKKLAATLMNYESVENVGVENINDNMYWVENVRYKDNGIVQFLVCPDENVHSMVKYGDVYLPVVSFKSDREVILDGSYEGSMDEINSAIKENIPEDVLNEWIQWLNN